MAIYHFSVKAVSRSSGRSATAAAAYRAGRKIADERTGEIHDYTRKSGVESADIVLPDGAPEWATDRAALWNAAELAEKRKDACVAREFEVALPHELPGEERRRLAVEFARDMANREGCAVDVAIHAPSDKHDNLNHHAHILRTTRKVVADGLGEKLDTEKAGRNRKDDLEAVRARWAEMTNAALERNGIAARVDHRSLAAQGIGREPTQHRGPAIDGLLRRGADSFVVQQQIIERLDRAMKAGELERAQRQTDGLILDLSGALEAAKAERSKEVAALDWSNFGGVVFVDTADKQDAPISQIVKQSEPQVTRVELAQALRREAQRRLGETTHEERDEKPAAPSDPAKPSRSRSDDLEV